MQKVGITLLVLSLMLLTFTIGIYMGTLETLKWTIEKARHFVEIDIDTDKFAQAIMNYKRNIDYCYPTM